MYLRVLVLLFAFLWVYVGGFDKTEIYGNGNFLFFFVSFFFSSR